LKKSILILLAVLWGVTSCKSYQKTTYDRTRKMRIGKLLREVKKHRFSAKTFESRMVISYTDANQSFSGNGKVRILKDSIIWGSFNFLGIPVVKFNITPDKIQYYNKINQTYYDGDFQLLQKELGLSFNFNNLQNLLTGDMIADLEPSNTELKTTPKSYRLIPHHALIKNLELSPFYKMLSGYFETKTTTAQLKYQNYQKIGNQNLPAHIDIKSLDKQIQLNYKKINLNKDLRFPFKIPSNYKPIKW